MRNEITTKRKVFGGDEMKVIEVTKSQVKQITMFLINNKLIFHPSISPNGTPDFTDYYGREYILIVDRNILTKLIDLCINGTLKDAYLLKVIGSIMFWTEFNNVVITSGVALNEYAHNLQNNENASKENNIFKEIFNFYSPIDWLDLALGKKQTISKIELSRKLETYVFNVENDHFKMHYSEMLRLTYLHLSSELSDHEKLIEFIKWNNQNLLFCQYTLVYACLLFSRKIKQLKMNNFEEISRNCKNQAWDLTYLSFWSTLYWDDNKSDEVYLFSTMDKALKKIFTVTHTMNLNPFIECFGTEKGTVIHQEYQNILKDRIKPIITNEVINSSIILEEKNIKKMLNNIGSIPADASSIR